jgi:hypothetical protein
VLLGPPIKDLRTASSIAFEVLPHGQFSAIRIEDKAGAGMEGIGIYNEHDLTQVRKPAIFGAWRVER